MIPPIVGVPGLGLVALGSLLADVLAELAPAQELDELGAEEQAQQQRGGSRDQDAPGDGAHQTRTPAASARHTELEPDPARTLDQHDISRVKQGGHHVRRGGRVRDRVQLPVEPLADRRRERPDRHEHLDAGPRHLVAELDVELAPARPELEHVAEHRHRARGSACAAVWARSSRAARIDIGLAL